MKMAYAASACASSRVCRFAAWHIKPATLRENDVVLIDGGTNVEGYDRCHAHRRSDRQAQQKSRPRL